MIEKAWKDFHEKQDWSYSNRSMWPTTKESFEAGYNSAIELINKTRELIEVESDLLNNPVDNN